jgi:hypothetical protein
MSTKNASQLHNQELLQLRFGETRMHNTEIMLADMQNSKRMDTLIHDTLSAAYVGFPFLQ